VWQDKSDLSPVKTYEHTFPNPEKGMAYRFELRDVTGKLLMLHTEGEYEAVTPASVKLGPQPQQPPGSRRESSADFAAAAEQDEKYSLFQVAESEYREGLKKFPRDVRLKEALGRLLATRNRYADAAPLLSEAAQTRMLDPELRYYLGLALAFSGKEEDARRSWIAVVPDGRFGPSALVGLASLEARAGNSSAALDFAQKAVNRRPSLLVARKLQVAILRHTGRDAEALQLLDAALALDPLDSFLRFEATRLGARDDALWPHLAADPERVLNLVDTYFDLGLYVDALDLLSRQYQATPANQAEPGAVLLQADALASYYRGYCLLKLGRDAGADFKLAASQLLEYVFPHRASTQAVLAAALQVNANDASAHFLTGLLDLDQNRPAAAISELQVTLAIRKDIPALHYVLGRALLLFNDRRTEAVAVLKEGISLNPSDKALKSLLAETPSARVALPPTARGAAKPLVRGTPASPEEWVQQALNLSAEGESANGIFNGQNFPHERQPESVRWAYIEVQLQALRRSAAQKDCRAVLSGVDSIGGKDDDIPFTAEGFEDLLKGARVQYFLGAVESLCGQGKSAQSRWTKVARLKPPVGSADFAFPALAAQSLAQKGRAFDLAPWLEKASKALNDGAEAKGLLDYSRGILLLAAGDERGAMAAFTAGAGEPDHDFSQYLNRGALAEAYRAAQPVR
jgi:predicted Zn-dependent protease